MTRETLPIKRPSPLTLVIIVVVLISAVILAMKNSFFRQEDSLSPRTDSVSSLSFDSTNEEIIKKVARHILVNESEVLDIALVQDATSLRSQSPYFYKDAEAGDRVLVWADKAVLYSVSRDLILSVLPVSYSAPSSTTTTSSVAADSLQEDRVVVEVRNGSGIPGQARTMAEKLTALGYSVLPAADAKTSYTETLVINASSTSLPKTMEALLKVTSGKAAPLPSVEGKVKGDIVIILGTSSTSSL